MRVEDNSDAGLEYLQLKKLIKDMSVFIYQNKTAFPYTPIAYQNRRFIDKFKKEHGL
jgi:hypothetical protein